MTTPTTQLTPAPPPATQTDDEFGRLLKGDFRPDGAFQTPDQFKHAQRIGKMLGNSLLVPEHFRGERNLPNAVIAVDMALRLKLNPLMVMSQLYMVHGKPGWSAQFVIATINISGKFDRLKFKVTGENDDRNCVAYAKDLTSEELLDGPPVSIGMAKAEGWYDKNGSKWKTLPDLMLRYRAAAFWSRLYAPELTMGLSTTEELEDIGPTLKIASPIFKEAAAELVPPPAPAETLFSSKHLETVSETLSSIYGQLAKEELTEAELVDFLVELAMAGEEVQKLTDLPLETLDVVKGQLGDMIRRIKEVRQ